MPPKRLPDQIGPVPPPGPHAAGYPERTISHSSRQDLNSCLRRYYHRTYTAHGARLGAGMVSETTLRAAALKRLTTLDLELGKAVHRLAQDRTLALVHGGPLATLREVQATLEQVVADAIHSSTHREAFLRAPQTRVMLRSAFYSDDQTPDPREIERVVPKIRRCAYNLICTPLWDRIARMSPGDLLVVEDFRSFDLDGITVLLRPDLIARDPEDGLLLLDHKTGATRLPEARAQLAISGLYAERELGIAAGDWLGWIENLWLGRRDRVRISRAELDRAAVGLRRGLELQESLLADPEVNRPLPMSEYPMLPFGERSYCQSCNFLALCDPRSSDTEGTGPSNFMGRAA